MEKQFYAYIHYKPDGAPFYVGKGYGNRYLPKHKRGIYHQNIIAKYGVENILVGKLECSTEQIALELECGLIRCLRRSGLNLANLTDGGEGISGYLHTTGAKSRIGAAAKVNRTGIKLSQLTRDKIRAANIGKKYSEEHRAKISAGGKGRKVSDETRIKMSAAQISRVRQPIEYTDELRKKLSVGGRKHKGRIISQEMRSKISSKLLGRKLSEETKAKISTALKGKKYTKKVS